MKSKIKRRIITKKLIKQYEYHLLEEEKSSATIKKYMRDILNLFRYVEGKPIDKLVILKWKSFLIEKYSPASVNSMIAAVNGFMNYLGWTELKLKQLKIQKSVFMDSEKELKKREYMKLVEIAKAEGKEKLSLIIQTICTTGIRVSELKFITVETLQIGKVEIHNKGKCRIIFLPQKLCELLGNYVIKEKITKGTVFVTKNGNPIDRSNIWKSMKALGKSAGITESKVFPHNLRHLFARTYYTIEKDLSRLSDILGHSNIDTTRIYTMESGNIHAKQMERMGLITT